MPEEFIEDILAETKPIENSEALKSPNEETVDNKTDVNTDIKIADTKNADAKIEPDVTIEDLATQIGWNANYKGKESIDAATYILKSREIQDTMKGHNTDLKTQLSDVKNSINDLKDHNKRVYQTEISRMQTELDSLKKQKRAAVEVADVPKVDELDKQIDDLQKDLNLPEPKNTSSSNPVFDEWVKDNQWYLTDSEMATYAETVADQYKGAPADKIYKVVRQKVMEIFPENFEDKESKQSKQSDQSKDGENLQSNNVKPIGPKSPVEAAKNNKVASTFTKADLTPEQTTIMNQFTKLGVMTEEQYIKDILKMQGEG